MKGRLIKYAVQRLADFGLDQKIVLYGRFFRDVLDNEFEIFTEQIPAVRLADYQWFDTLDDSLHRGSGQVWTGDPSKPNYPYGDDRHYRFVTVSRADLIREFPASTATQQTGVSLFTVAEIDAWIESAPYSGMKVARKAFLKELRAKGLSASFEREWQAIKKNPVGRPITRK